MQIVATNNAPQAIGPYSQAMKHGGMIFTSGQIALRADGTFLDDDDHEMNAPEQIQGAECHAALARLGVHADQSDDDPDERGNQRLEHVAF